MRKKGNDKPKNEYSVRLLQLYSDKKIDTANNCHWASDTVKDMLLLGILNFEGYAPQLNDYGKDITITKKINEKAKTLKNHISPDYTGGISTAWIKVYCDYFGCSADYLLGYIKKPLHTPYDDIPLSFDSIQAINRIKQRFVNLNKQSAMLAEYGGIYQPHNTMRLLNFIISNPVFENMLCYIEDYIYPQYNKPVIVPNDSNDCVMPSKNNRAYKRPCYNDKGVLITDNQGKPVYENLIPFASDDLMLDGYKTVSINDSFMESIAMLEIQKSIDSIKRDYIQNA